MSKHKQVTKMFFWGGSLGFLLGVVAGLIFDVVNIPVSAKVWMVLAVCTVLLGLAIISWALGLLVSVDFRVADDRMIPRKYYGIIAAFLVLLLFGIVV